MHFSVQFLERIIDKHWSCGMQNLCFDILYISLICVIPGTWIIWFRGKELTIRRQRRHSWSEVSTVGVQLYLLTDVMNPCKYNDFESALDSKAMHRDSSILLKSFQWSFGPVHACNVYLLDLAQRSSNPPIRHFLSLGNIIMKGTTLPTAFGLRAPSPVTTHPISIFSTLMKRRATPTFSSLAW